MGSQIVRSGRHPYSLGYGLKSDSFLFDIREFAKFTGFTGSFMRERGCGYNPKDPEKGKRIRIMRVTSEPNLVTLFFFFTRVIYGRFYGTIIFRRY